MDSQHTTTLGASLSTSVVTAFVASWPEAFGYLEKVGSVLLLAMVAELGRRFIALLWKKKS